jgi:hypothetical protein
VQAKSSCEAEVHVQPPHAPALFEPIEQVLADRLDLDEARAVELGRVSLGTQLGCAARTSRYSAVF